jgi:hypothetical protein
MTFVGWLNQDGHVLTLPNFTYHNGETAKKRALGKNRQEKHRNNDESNAISNASSVTNLLLEKRREEKIVNKDAYASLSADDLPTCPHQEILILYKKHLPHLTQPRVWEGSRQTSLRQRWRQAARPSNYSPDGYKTLNGGLAWWDSFFGYIANDSTLAQGFKTKDRTWHPDLEWIINATNFAKIIDGKYSK